MTTQSASGIQGCEICCIGHITLDKIITPHFTKEMPGGTAYYFAKALKGFEHSGFKLVTSIGSTEMGVIKELQADGIDVTVIPSRQSVCFENKYGDDMNDRTQRVLAKADPFMAEKLSGIEARIFHLGTLLADDFDLEVIKMLSGIGIVSVDVQGYLRKVVGERVVPVDYSMKKEALPYISILKANEMEMQQLTGTDDPHKAARILSDWGCREVLLTLGDKGSVIYAGGTFYHIPAFTPQALVDATGCGDTYMAGYLYMRSRGASYEEAGTFAAAMCSIKLSESGPLNATEDDVMAFISKHSLMVDATPH